MEKASVELPLATVAGPVVLRPERDTDAAMLSALFFEIHSAALAGVPAPMRDSLLRMQFAAQAQTYRAAYPVARFDVILQGGAPIGRVVTDGLNGAGEGCIVDYALAAERRHAGLGGAILRALLERFAGRAVSASVLEGNVVSLAMFHRAGFAVVASEPPYVHVRRSPRPAPSPPLAACDARGSPGPRTTP